MKLSLRHTLSKLLLAAMSVSAPHMAAQTLNEEVTVRHEDLLSLPETTKPTIYPRLDLPAPAPATLNYSLRPVTMAVPARMSTLDPVAYADTIATSTHRGYAAAGFMPAFNLAAAAGYKFIDTDHTRLNIWGQYDGSAYRPKSFFGNGAPTVRQNTLSLGGALHQAVARESFVDLGIDYTLSGFNAPYSGNSDYTSQRINDFNARAAWSLANASIRGGFDLTFGHFGFGSGMNLASENGDIIHHTPVSENRLSACAHVNSILSSTSQLGIDATFSLTGNNGAGVRSHSLLRIHPHYLLHTPNFTLNAGAELALTFRGGKAFHIAPKVEATWTPSHHVAIFAKTGGGVVQNNLSSLYDATPYFTPCLTYANSNVPFTAEVGTTLGRRSGFYAEVALTFGAANSWLMPVAPTDGPMQFEALNLRGFKIRAAAGWNYRNILDVNFAIEKAPHKYKRAWFEWRDRAETVVSASLLVLPIAPLAINVGWQYRGSRAYIDSTGNNSSLGNLSNLSIGASYRLNDRWSVMLQGDNLLNRHFLLIGSVPAQGITGLAGASYQF